MREVHKGPAGARRAAALSLFTTHHCGLEHTSASIGGRFFAIVIEYEDIPRDAGSYQLADSALRRARPLTKIKGVARLKARRTADGERQDGNPT